MATSRKPGGSSSRSPNKARSSRAASAGATKRAATAARKPSGSRSAASRRKVSARQSDGSTTTAQSTPAKSDNGRATIAKGALGALAGTAALGLAGRAAIKRVQRPRVLGVRLPRGLEPGNLDLRKVARQIGNFAERLEHTSEDVRMVSAQARRVSKKLS